jgi:hypothetical protein
MTPEAKFRDPEIHCSKFGDLSDTCCQLQRPPVNFPHVFLVIPEKMMKFPGKEHIILSWCASYINTISLCKIFFIIYIFGYGRTNRRKSQSERATGLRLLGLAHSGVAHRLLGVTSWVARLVRGSSWVQVATSGGGYRLCPSSAFSCKLQLSISTSNTGSQAFMEV